ncbi:MAG: VOC family protein [Limisphaerales bacterium]
MSTTARIIQPYLFFGGRCEEALEFYRKALGAQIEMVMQFKDSPDPMPPGALPPGYENKVMHASFRVGGSLIMASDGCGDSKEFAGFSLSIALATVEDTDRVFAALAEGGNVTMPLGKTFWSERFGMLTDRFGVAWLVTIAT